jgi:hypothetical protein
MRMYKDGNHEKMHMRKMTYNQKAAHAQDDLFTESSQEDAHAQRWQSRDDAHAQRWQSRDDAHAQRWQSRIDAHAQR